MKLIKSSLLVFLLVISSWAVAQSSASNQKSYQNGKELFNQGKYELAMQMFSPLTQERSNNPYEEYASFFYALSAYHSGQKTTAKNMLLQIMNKYAGWKDIDEARLWLARIHFEEKDFDKAFTTLNEIKNKNLKGNVESMKLHFLEELADLETLKSLHEKYPKDKEVGVILADKIYAEPLGSQGPELLNSLVSQFKLDPEKYAAVGPGPSKKKESYNVAVLLPLLSDEVKRGRNVGNQFVIDLYEGIRLGHEKLQEEGIDINIFAYDTRRDSATTEKLLALDEMKSMDLIMGPLYPVPSKLTSHFSMRNKVNMINPISNNSQVIGNNPFSFLFRPSYQAQAREAAAFASATFENKKAIIIHGTSFRDSVLAHTYRAEAERNGIQVSNIVKVDASQPKKAYTLVSENEEEESMIPSNSVGHIYVASIDETIIANLLSGLNTRTDDIALIGSEEWLDYKFVSYDQMERFKIYFVAPNFIDFSKPSVEKFRQKFINVTKTLPSPSAYAGYEAMVFCGRMLKKHGIYFQNELEKEGSVEAELYPVINFSGSNYNQFVPIVQMQRADLVMVNGE